MRYIYWALSVGSLGLVFFDGPSGSLLTSKPERGKVTRDAQGKAKTTVRGRGPAFIWLGGGYRGGK